MIIDMHTHTYPDILAARVIRQMELEIEKGQGFRGHAESSGKVSDLSKNTKEAGIDLSIMLPVATNIRQAKKLNKISFDLNEKNEYTNLFAMGTVHPDNEDYKEIIDDVVSMGLKGIKIHPDYQGTFFNDEKYIRIMDYAASKDLIIITHAGEDIGLPDVIHCTPDMVLDVWSHIQPEKLVLAHMGGWKQWDEVEEKLVGLPVYFDTAICMNQNVPIHLKKDQFVRIVKNHGADRVLFGTDSPWYNQKKAITDIRQSGLADQELELVLGKNAERMKLMK